MPFFKGNKYAWRFKQLLQPVLLLGNVSQMSDVAYGPLVGYKFEKVYFTR